MYIVQVLTISCAAVSHSFKIDTLSSNKIIQMTPSRIVTYVVTLVRSITLATTLLIVIKDA